MENKKNCIVLTGGGTAGHVMVNINLQDELKKYFNEIIYIGSENGIEKELVTKQSTYKYVSIPTIKFERNKPFKIFIIPFKLKKSVSKAKEILKDYSPSIIFTL